MSYCYDIILNWNEEASYNFYEWNDTDYLELIKKIPLFKVKYKILLELIENKIKIDNDFLELIKDKTLISGKNILNKVDYAALFTDGKSVIAIEFDTNGLSISRSNLLIDDEINVIESIYNLKESIINYEIVKKIKINTNLRQEEDAKKIIILEINNLYKNKELSKLMYLYYEYKKEKMDNIDEIYQNIIKDIDGEFNQDILKLYYIIKLSYHNV